MRYLVNRTTKEHQRMPFDCLYAPSGWSVVQADSEGWIPHTGDERPLPEDAKCDIKCVDGKSSLQAHGADQWGWNKTNSFRDITHYRPILAEKVQEPATDAARKERAAELSQIELAGKRMMLLDRLKAAHEHAQTIPDLEAELREVLGSMGYDLVARSPFVEAEPAVETPQANALCTPSVTDALVYGTSVMKNGKHVPLKDFYAEPAEDMSDWRNWCEGDLVECVNGSGWSDFTKGGIYAISASRKNMIEIAGNYIQERFINDFRFHSRPAKWEK